MGMFDNYQNNTPPDNSNSSSFPCNIKDPECKPKPDKENKFLDPCEPKIPYTDYNMKGEIIGYWWYYLDTVNLEFNISGEVVVEDSQEYITAEDFLQDKKITFKLYNFRREPILTLHFPGSTKVMIEIDDELSRKLVKGVYYCTLDVWNGQYFNKTIYTQENCTLTVK